ncbi:MAG: replicative DNA helicase [SAR202 cluster bacterium]|mgnify:FL=1|nr:replicative DNA helicase [Chloroflexota bacterium]MDP6421574.1 replicative DNA helicase [SAR202 cluster bacterium]HAL46877.1 replicative DNA helicase [Dehalococcoidia bacterium]MDP6664649.1 replicative DNA helicase [SAR202 cluster bacterium]MDP6798490.1 replicative DNA helicase [SAR202 cluster bacterium]
MVLDLLPPHDNSAEESVVGSVLIDGESLTRVTSFLKSPDFYGQKNRWCFEACLALMERGEAINQVTVSHELSLHDDRLESVGGAPYLAHLVATVPTSVHIEQYAQIVQRTSIMRQIIRAGERIAEIGYQSGPDAEAAISNAEQLLYGVRSGRGTRDFTPIRQFLDIYMEASGAVESSDASRLAPVITGFSQIDELLGGGLQRSDLVIVAARTSLGKSTLALNMARHAATQGFSVGVFSLEMSGEQIAMRLLASEANVDSHRLRINLINNDEESRVLDAIGMLSDLPLYIDETPFQTMMEIRGKSRRLQAERGLDFLIVDYLQLIDTGRNDNRAVALGEVSRSLKSLARELDIPILACAQLSRAPDQRPNHRPMLSDLRESGSIEQDADVVAFIYREDIYTDREDWERKFPTQPYPENVAEIMVLKHRNGPTGTVPLLFQPDMVRFESLPAASPTPTLEYV